MDYEIKRPNYQDCDGFIIPAAFSQKAFRSAVNYIPKPGQLFIVSFPKCGMTLMQQIIFLIFNKGKPASDFGKVMKNSPYLELNGADAVDFMDGPGAIKIHLPFNLAPYSPDAKYIYVARNPRDCCVSFYHHTKNGELYNFSDGTFDEFFDLFVNGQVEGGDYFDHLLSWYRHKDDPNVHFVTYENLKTAKRNEIMKIAKFMGDEHYDNLLENKDILENVLKYSSFQYMKNIVHDHLKELSEKPKLIHEDVPLPSGSKAFREYMKNHPHLSVTFKGEFIRKGIIGDWKNHFSPEQERRMDEKIKKKFGNSDVMNLWSEK